MADKRDVGLKLEINEFQSYESGFRVKAMVVANKCFGYE